MQFSTDARVPGRDTHAKIYQGEFSPSEYEELKKRSLAKGVPAPGEMKDLVTTYLGHWKGAEGLEVEEVPLGDGSVRFYLWVPYQTCDELEKIMQEKGAYLQKLVRKAFDQGVTQK